MISNANETVIKQAFEQPEWYLKKTAYNIKIRVETVKHFVKDAKTESILDIGCGDGSLSLHLLNQTNRLTLVDRSKSMLQIASSRVPERLSDHVKILNDDFMTVPLPPQNFDLIICVGVLAYVDELRLFLGKIASVLGPDGTVIIECSDGDHFIRRANRAYGALRRRLGAGDFQTAARPSSAVVSTFKELGFELCDSFRYSQPVPVIRKLLPQPVSYGAIRLLFGSAGQSRAAWLGSECLYHFKRVAGH
jgi:cyclopropane fatty-acyl-phospholipid synthase-like methyltransferase